MTPFWFDLLYLDGQPVIDEPQSRRFAELVKLSEPGNLVPNLTTADRPQAENFLREALQQGHEGIMAKSPGAPYTAGARGQSWLKIKQARTLDLVILSG